MDRRLFLRYMSYSAAAMAAAQTGMLPDILGGMQNVCASDLKDKLSSVEAKYYTKFEDGSIECNLCPRYCLVNDNERGDCGVRENRGGKYYTLVYGLPCALNIDPIEKKPLFHFHPSTTALSLATAGCNCKCKFCQNWEISQSRPEQTNNYNLSPKEAVDICKSKNIPSIAYTYSEPIIFYEYMYDIAKLGQKESIKSVMITGGLIEKKPLADLMQHLDAIKVDLKSIRNDYYRKIVHGELKPVL
ncbi:MAG: radical SAM protein, partial [candidate division Zixibacteria bacterium]|nr:radical SAM protein [candidate division Zixibacteria bacterium]